MNGVVGILKGYFDNLVKKSWWLGPNDTAVDVLSGQFYKDTLWI